MRHHASASIPSTKLLRTRYTLRYTISNLGVFHGCHSHKRDCPGGGTGRRKGLKIPRPNGRAGSRPAPGTSLVFVAFAL